MAVLVKNNNKKRLVINERFLRLSLFVKKEKIKSPITQTIGVNKNESIFDKKKNIFTKELL